MKKSTKALSVGAAVIAALVALAGCSGGNAPDSSGPEKVVFWGSWSGDQVAQLDAQTKAFNASQDKYAVSYVSQELVEQKLLTGIASGNVPDVLLWDRNQTALYAPKGALASVDDLVARDKVKLGDFYEEPLSEMEVGGKLYGLPLLVDNRSLFYNAKMLADAGVQPPTTWAELKTAAEKLTVHDASGKLTRSGFAVNDPGLFNMWLPQAGGELLTADGKNTAYNSPEGLAVLDYWKSLVDGGVYQQGFADGTDGFAEGTVAMKLDGPWALAGLDKVEGLDYGIVSPPAGPGGDTGAITGGFGLVIPKGAKNVEGAWAFMKWWTTQPQNGIDFAKVSGWIPANTVAANDSYFTGNPHYSAFIQTMKYAKVRPNIKGYSDVEGKALVPALQKFMSGEVGAQEALKEAQTQGDQILADNR